MPSDILPDTKSDIPSDIWSDKPSDILPDIKSDITSDIWSEVRSDNVVHLLTLFATRKLLLRTTALPSHAFYMPFGSMLVLARLLLWLCSFLVSVRLVGSICLFFCVVSSRFCAHGSLCCCWCGFMWVNKYVYIIYTNLDVSEQGECPY